MWQVYFVNYYQSKNHKQRCKINELLYKVIGKSWLNTPIKALGSSVNFLTVRGRWEWKILAVWIAHFILFLFCNEPTKKIYGVHTLTTEPPPSPIRTSSLLAGPPTRPAPRSERTYLWLYRAYMFFFLLENLMKTEGFNDLRFIDFCVNQALLYYIYMAVFIVGLQTRSNQKAVRHTNNYRWSIW